jgi:hypothetical protein
VAKPKKVDPRAATKQGKALLKAGVEFELLRRNTKQFVLEDSPANLRRAEAALAESHTGQWKGLAKQYAKGDLGSMQIGDVAVSFRKAFATPKKAPTTPAAWVDAFVAETSKVSNSRTAPDALPAGRTLLALDAANKAQAIVHIYGTTLTLEGQDDWKRHPIILELTSRLLRGRLPLEEKDVIALFAEAATSKSRWRADFGRVLVAYVARQKVEAPSAPMRAAITAFRARAGADKKLEKACAELLGRGETFYPK